MKHWARTVLLATWLAVPLGAAPVSSASPEEFDDVAARLAEAGAALDEARAPEVPLETLADAITRYDRALAAVRGLVLQAGTRESEIRLQMLREAERITELIALMERMTLARTPALGLHPQGPVAAARAEMMADALRPMLTERADEITERLDAIARAEARQTDGIALIGTGLAQLAEARSALAGRLRGVAGHPVSPQADLAAALVEADSLGDLTAALRREVLPSGRSATRAGARPVIWPVDRSLLRGFNERDAAGVRWPGIVMSAPPLSLVRAPDDAKIHYAGPFLDYRAIVVMEAPGPVLIVFANLAELAVRTGERVRQGAPLGLLGGRSPTVEDYVKPTDLETGSGLREALYIEVRDGGGPIDPVAWFDGKRE